MNAQHMPAWWVTLIVISFDEISRFNVVKFTNTLLILINLYFSEDNVLSKHIVCHAENAVDNLLSHG